MSRGGKREGAGAKPAKERKCGMQVGLNTRIELDLRVRLDAQVEKEKRALAQVVAEAVEKYLDANQE